MPTPSVSSSTADPLIITIDGPAGAGKSTVAKLLAQRLRLRYLDTGATYRALAYAALSRRINPHEETRLARLAHTLKLVFVHTGWGRLRILLDGRDVTRRIRTEAVTDAAAIVAQHPRVRAVLVRLQRRLIRSNRLVVEGRDTGTVVFPRASYKFFLTADARVRARRRHTELQSVQGRSPSLSTIAGQLRTRDRLDRRRRVGPLIKPPGAIVVNTSHLRAPDVVKRVLQHLPVAISNSH